VISPQESRIFFNVSDFRLSKQLRRTRAETNSETDDDQDQEILHVLFPPTPRRANYMACACASGNPNCCPEADCPKTPALSIALWRQDRKVPRNLQEGDFASQFSPFSSS